MKKQNLLLAAGGLLVAAVAWAATYSATIINNPVLAIDTTATVNMNTVVRGGITQLSAQAVYSSATVAASTFNDGRVSTGSITVVTPASLTSAYATNQITLAGTSTLLAASATNYLTVLSTQSLAGAVITYGPNKVRQGHEWSVVSTTSGTAANITTALNKYHGLTATRTNSAIALSLTPGAAGNGKALSVNVSSITAGGAAFGGGHNSRIASAVVTANGQILRQGYEWQAADTSSGTATNLAAILNKVTGIHASAAGSVVYSTATSAGSAGNSFTITSNLPSYVTVAHPTFSGGRSAAYVRINGVTLTQGTNWTAVATASGTAKAVSDAIVANSSLNSVLVSTWSSGVVTLTSRAAGASQNYTLVTNASPAMTLSGANLTGGLTPAWSLNGTAITKASHGLGTGLGVAYSTGTAVGISGLTFGTTYYVAKIDANTFALATSRANAIAGTYITLASSSTAGPHSYTLTPASPTGSAGLVWQYSNDCTNWTNMNVSSVTFASPYTAGSTSWNFGTVGYTCVRAAFTATTLGAVNLQLTVNGQ